MHQIQVDLQKSKEKERKSDLNCNCLRKLTHKLLYKFSDFIVINLSKLSTYRGDVEVAIE